LHREVPHTPHLVLPKVNLSKKHEAIAETNKITRI
jgi:hypothetical protein